MSHFGSQSKSQAGREFYWCYFLVFYSSDFVFALEFLAACPCLYLHHWLHTTRSASTTPLAYMNLNFRNLILVWPRELSVNGSIFCWMRDYKKICFSSFLFFFLCKTCPSTTERTAFLKSVPVLYFWITSDVWLTPWNQNWTLSACF